ncbi:MAG: GAF domain-containing protein [Acidobacteriota bacterium]|nr:GAF domain-containing protein [Acidobacteriota bacterium]
MSLGLEKLASCFQGIVPALLYTCAKDGTPNAAYLSQVEYVDPTHVALSFQFFNKSRRNIAENPQAVVHVTDPDTAQGWALRLRFERSETSGPIFERMFWRIEAIASYTGMKGIFKLRAADIYQVESVEKVPEEEGQVDRSAPPLRAKPPDPVFTMKALQDLSMQINTADSLEHLLDSIVVGLKRHFNFSHSMIALAGEKPDTLVMIASRGYEQSGAGAEIQFGEGIMGLVAEAKKPIRISGLLRGMLHAYAAKRRAEETGWCADDRRVPLPGLENPSSQLGVPLMVRGELVGVLCIESETPYRFHEEDKTAIELLGSYLAVAIQNMQLQQDEDDDRDDAGRAGAGFSRPASASRRELTYYRGEEVVMLDGEYLIRSLPARILWKLLQAHRQEGRAEFTNRELRLDKSLGLPAFKDNLETRLLLLRRRLDEKAGDIRLVPRGRGRFALEVGGDLELIERD